MRAAIKCQDLHSHNRNRTGRCSSRLRWASYPSPIARYSRSRSPAISARSTRRITHQNRLSGLEWGRFISSSWALGALESLPLSISSKRMDRVGRTTQSQSSMLQIPFQLPMQLAPTSTRSSGVRIPIHSILRSPELRCANGHPSATHTMSKDFVLVTPTLFSHD